jgi:hypothetical protein
MNISTEDKTVINQLINKYNIYQLENYINNVKKYKTFNEDIFNDKVNNLINKHDIKKVLEDDVKYIEGNKILHYGLYNPDNLFRLIEIKPEIFQNKEYVEYIFQYLVGIYFDSNGLTYFLNKLKSNGKNILDYSISEGNIELPIDKYVLIHGNYLCFKVTMEHIITINHNYDIFKLIKYVETFEHNKESWIYRDFIKNDMVNEILAFIRSLHYY